METIIALSLALRTAVRQIKSLADCGVRTKVSNLTQWGSVLGSLNLSTHIHVLYVKPVCGGNNLSPKIIFYMLITIIQFLKL